MNVSKKIISGIAAFAIALSTYAIPNKGVDMSAVSSTAEIISETPVRNMAAAVAAPTGLKVAARAADALRFSWARNSKADGYIVEMYKNNQWVRAGKITKNSTTEFKKSGLAAGTVYKFRVKAYKMSGSSAIYSAYTTISARTNPSKVTGLKVAATAKDAVRISWTKNTSADGYIVEMYKGGKWVRAGKITKNSTTEFKKSGLAAGTVYKFRVCAYKMSGSTALYGNYASVSAGTNMSSGVSGLTVSGSENTALTLKWNKNSSASGYIVEMYKDGKWVRATKITNNTTVQFKKTGLTAGTSYNFRVCAYKMSGSTALYSDYTSISATTDKVVSNWREFSINYYIDRLYDACGEFRTSAQKAIDAYDRLLHNQTQSAGAYFNHCIHQFMNAKGDIGFALTTVEGQTPVWVNGETKSLAVQTREFYDSLKLMVDGVDLSSGDNISYSVDIDELGDICDYLLDCWEKSQALYQKASKANYY